MPLLRAAAAGGPPRSVRVRALVAVPTAVVLGYYMLLAPRESEGTWEVGIGSAPPPPDAGSWLGWQSSAGGVSRWGHLDWMPSRRKDETHKDFDSARAQTAAWREGERRLPCEGSDNATAEVREGAEKMHRHVSLAYVKPVTDPAEGQRHFRAALRAAPKCSSARLNYCISVMAQPEVTTEFGDCIAMLSAIPDASPLKAKSLLYRGFFKELLDKGIEAHDLYHKAFELDPRLARIYWGKPRTHWAQQKRPCTFFADPRMKNAEARVLQLRTLRKLLFFSEFTEHFGGYTHYTKEEAVQFLDVWYTMIRNLVPPYALRALQECYRGYIELGALKFNDVQSKRWFHYNDPVVRFISATYNSFISMVTDQATKSTYTYMGAYPGGSELPPHVDRAQCEWTMTVSVDVNPADQVCPVGVRKEPKKLSKVKSFGKNVKPDDPDKSVYVYPHPGDAVLFRGRGMVHWRDRIPEHMNCTNFFLHYVLEDYEGKMD
eukprot:TRINITY_DN22739_c0_g1_i1.p1 TRINITY_DN22739_c0_g1~~TRINITY_DN22739_c0_g1_i1.p1  ORF type:complete len:540 (+),score=152.19 TRINITY_DN22739_c0_g1_i1:155-1621(+)